VREILSSAFVERAREQLLWFAVVLLISVAFTFLVSRERRRRLGLTSFLLGYLCIAAVPIFGVIVLRSALREGLEQAGHGWWAALWLSLFWMVTFIVVAQWVVRRVPPTRGWLRDYRQAGRDIWRERLARWFGIRSRDGSPAAGRRRPRG
jgi:MFS family permease